MTYTEKLFNRLDFLLGYFFLADCTCSDKAYVTWIIWQGTDMEIVAEGLFHLLKISKETEMKKGNNSTKKKMVDNNNIYTWLQANGQKLNLTVSYCLNLILKK